MLLDPDRAIEFLERRVQPSTIDSKHIERLIADFSSDQANSMEAATRELTRIGPLVESALRTAQISNNLPAATQKRVETLLLDLDQKNRVIASDESFHVRAVQVLERIGT